MSEELNINIENNEVGVQTLINVQHSLLRLCGNNGEILRIEPDGDLFVKNKLITNDKEVVDGLREFLKDQGFLK